jgi:hypothetical protein
VFRSLLKHVHEGPDRFPDATGYEAFVNKFTLDYATKLEAVHVGHRCAHAIARYLQVHAEFPCRVILAIDEVRVVIRFHVRRAGEVWLTPDLDACQEPVLALDYPEYLAYPLQPPQYPTRSDIEAAWRSILDGSKTRDEVSRWAEPLMFGDDDLDVMVASALPWLHGFDLVRSIGVRDDGSEFNGVRHGAGAEYLRSNSEVAERLNQWLLECAAYDQNPRAFMLLRYEAGLEHG